MGYETIENAEIKECARLFGADLVGVASIDRFESLPSDMHPRSIQPDAAAVVVLGFSIPRGSLRGVELQTAWHTFAMGTPYAHFIHKTYLLCRHLESQGWEAVPLFHHDAALRHKGVQVSADRPEPDVVVDLEYAAHAAGLGGIGAGKLFLTPEFGPRQILTAVVTDAPIAPDAIRVEPVCDGCGDCVRACPAQALDAAAFSEGALCDGKARWHTLRIESCLVCKTGPLPRPYSGGGEPLRVGAACGRACVAHLEASGRLTRTYRNPFRPSGEVAIKDLA